MGDRCEDARLEGGESVSKESYIHCDEDKANEDVSADDGS